MEFNEAVLQTEKALDSLTWANMPKGIIDPIDHILDLGGKRIRPALVLMACDMFGGDINNAVPAALGVEMFHNSSLLHDDLMDNSDLRRNKPTVHKKWNANTAILSGDLMIVKSFDLVNQSKTDRLKQVIDTFSEITAGVCAGQQYDLEFETRTDVSVDEYINMIKHKTAVLLAGSLKLGAIIGGASEGDAQRMYDFGINLGLSFQLQDDFLDVFGDVAEFGKAIGNDIVSNKKTFLLISALEQAENTDKDELHKWLNAANFDKNEKIKAVTNLYVKLKIDQQSKAQSEAFFTDSLQSIKNITVNNGTKDAIIKLAEKLLNRNK